jgi:hypothetical protein
MYEACSDYVKIEQETRGIGIHVINSFIPSYVQEYETRGVIKELLQSFLNIKFLEFSAYL